MTSSFDIQADLFRHVSVEKAALYRAVMDVFAAAHRQFRLHLQPDWVISKKPVRCCATTAISACRAAAALTCVAQGVWCSTNGSTALAPASRNNVAATVADQPLR